MAIQGFRTKYNGEFDASELFKELNQIKPEENHWTFTSPAAMIGIALVIFHADLEEMFQHCSISRDTYSGTIGPPMPIPNQPQIHRATPATNNQATKSNASVPINIKIS
jgi:hypothetical protein